MCRHLVLEQFRYNKQWNDGQNEVTIMFLIDLLTVVWVFSHLVCHGFVPEDTWTHKSKDKMQELWFSVESLQVITRCSLYIKCENSSQGHSYIYFSSCITDMMGQIPDFTLQFPCLTIDNMKLQPVFIWSSFLTYSSTWWYCSFS